MTTQRINNETIYNDDGIWYIYGKYTEDTLPDIVENGDVTYKVKGIRPVETDSIQALFGLSTHIVTLEPVEQSIIESFNIFDFFRSGPILEADPTISADADTGDAPDEVSKVPVDLNDDADTGDNGVDSEKTTDVETPSDINTQADPNPVPDNATDDQTDIADPEAEPTIVPPDATAGDEPDASTDTYGQYQKVEIRLTDLEKKRNTFDLLQASYENLRRILKQLQEFKERTFERSDDAQNVSKLMTVVEKASGNVMRVLKGERTLDYLALRVYQKTVDNLITEISLSVEKLCKKRINAQE